MKPSVSVGLPVFNGGRYLRQAVDSVLSQTYTDFELIVSDNGSTDDTEDICREYAARDSRVRYYRSEKNRGAAWNFNRLVALARGRCFKWMAADDVLLPQLLAECAAVLDTEATVVLSYSRLADIDDRGRELRPRVCPFLTGAGAPHERFAQFIRMDHTCEAIFGLIRADVLRRTDLIGAYSDSDRVLLAELALHGPFKEIPEVLFLHRLHPRSSVRTYPSRIARMVWFDPAAGERVALPYWREFFELLRAIRRARPPWRARIRCYGQVCRWSVRYRALLRGDLRLCAAEIIGRHVPGARAAWRRLNGARTEASKCG